MRQKTLVGLMAISLISFCCVLRLQAAEQMKITMPLVAPLFLENETVASTLTVVNEANIPTKATLVVLDLSGAMELKKDVVFAAHSQRKWRLSEILADVPEVTAGSIYIHPDPDLKGMDLAAQLSMTINTGFEPQYIEEELVTPMMEGS